MVFYLLEMFILLIIFVGSRLGNNEMFILLLLAIKVVSRLYVYVVAILRTCQRPAGNRYCTSDM